jgi:hypothetical protein
VRLVDPLHRVVLGEAFTYKQAMGGLMVVVFLGVITVTWLGPEARGISFRKTAP